MAEISLNLNLRALSIEGTCFNSHRYSFEILLNFSSIREYGKGLRFDTGFVSEDHGIKLDRAELLS